METKSYISLGRTIQLLAQMCFDIEQECDENEEKDNIE